MTLWNGIELPESYFHDDNVYIIKGDSGEVLSDFPEKCIDLTVTSPPYDNLRNYNGYSFNFEQIVKNLYRTHKDGGVVVWVVSDATIKGTETGTSFRQALYFKEVGFNLHDTMIYNRGAQGGAKGSNYCYTQSFEYMFVFSKDKPSSINLLKDRPNTYKHKGRKRSTMRKPDGKTYEFSSEFNEFSKRTNVWDIRGGYMVGSPDLEAFQHPASFPEALANDHIQSWSKDNDILLDPLLGSGTTMKMAIRNNRKCVGIEISEEYCELSAIRYLRSLSK